jgi:hypothetical protein
MRPTEDIEIIRSYINSITRSNQTLRYPSNETAEERALQWLIDEDVNFTFVNAGELSNNFNGVDQRYALATLRFGSVPTTMPFGGPGHALTWTNPGIDECDWTGVECLVGVTVVGLDLEEADIRGPIPDDLGLLTELTELQLSINAFTGTIPSSQAALTFLAYLDLSDNQLDGTIPSSLTALTALTSLDLNYNQLGGTIPSSLAAFTDLQYLALGNNQLDGTIPSSLAAFTDLQYLDLGNNQLDGTIPSSFAALTALTYLDLYNNQLDGTIPSFLAAMTALTVLDLSSNQLVGTMPFCNSDQSFVTLVADCMEVNCSCCTDCCPTAFGNIPVYLFC